ncbi:MAG: STAS domain-containing protein [bacterium]
MQYMQVQTQEISLSEKIVIIKVGGYLDVVTAEALDRALEAIIKSKCYRIIIDLDEAEYIGSMGWSIFLNKIKELRDHGGDLKLAKMNADVFEVYKLLEFFWFLKSYSTLEEAVSDFALEVQPMP